MNEADIRLLEAFLDAPERPAGTFRFHELQGFLFSIASSPESVAPSEWLPMIGDDQELGFADLDEAQEILGRLMALYNEINTAVLERSNALPAGCVFNEEILKNFEADTAISQWSRGFTAGHDWLSDVWDEYLFGEIDEECGATLMILSFFGSERLGRAYFNDMRSAKRKRGGQSFEDFAETMRRMFPDALASYANIGRSIFEALLEHRAAERRPASSEKIGRNEPCPCGSGKKYKTCCGGPMH